MAIAFNPIAKRTPVGFPFWLFSMHENIPGLPLHAVLQHLLCFDWRLPCVFDWGPAGYCMVAAYRQPSERERGMSNLHLLPPRTSERYDSALEPGSRFGHFGRPETYRERLPQRALSENKSEEHALAYAETFAFWTSLTPDYIAAPFRSEPSRDPHYKRVSLGD